MREEGRGSTFDFVRRLLCCHTCYSTAKASICQSLFLARSQVAFDMRRHCPFFSFFLIYVYFLYLFFSPTLVLFYLNSMYFWRYDTFYLLLVFYSLQFIDSILKNLYYFSPYYIATGFVLPYFYEFDENQKQFQRSVTPESFRGRGNDACATVIFYMRNAGCVI